MVGQAFILCEPCVCHRFYSWKYIPAAHSLVIDYQLIPSLLKRSPSTSHSLVSIFLGISFGDSQNSNFFLELLIRRHHEFRTCFKNRVKQNRWEAPRGD
jgi:hypothetical protein